MIITPEQKEKLEKIGKKYDLRFIILHGSYAKNTPRAGSDLDIAILGKELIDFVTQMKIFVEFENVFGNSKEREIDLKTLHKVDPLFRYYATRDGVLLYGDLTDFNEFRAYASRCFEDIGKLLYLEEFIIKKQNKIILEKFSHA